MVEIRLLVRQDFARAARAYSNGTRLADNYFKSVSKTDIEQDTGESIDPLDLTVVAVYVACLNNLAACHISMGEFLKAKDMCIKVLEFDSSNEKALLRAAKATLALHNFEECEVCLKTLFEITPNHPAGLVEQ
eukprot:gene30809-38079_t